jgi:hypothetical protein
MIAPANTNEAMERNGPLFTVIRMIVSAQHLRRAELADVTQTIWPRHQLL